MALYLLCLLNRLKLKQKRLGSCDSQLSSGYDLARYWKPIEDEVRQGVHRLIVLSRNRLHHLKRFKKQSLKV